MIIKNFGKYLLLLRFHIFSLVILKEECIAELTTAKYEALIGQ